MNLTPKLGAMIRARAPPIRKTRPPPEGLFCLYPHRTCMQNRLDGYEFCAKHILEDKNSAYKQCNYMSGKSGKRCPCAAPKSDKKEGYCLEHSRRSQYLRQRASRKRRPRETPETLLEQIEHYGSKVDGGRDIKRGRPSNESVTSRVLEYASSSDSESERPAVDQAWPGDVDSDAESVDSEQEDALKHAGVYTAEEVALITKDKLIRLQSLYIEQFKRLQHIMREKRRRYLRTVKIERETLGSVHAAKEDPEQRETYDKLVAMKRYHKRYGREALLHRQSKERRISASEGTNYKPPSFPKCQHQTAGGKCLARTIPLAKFCFNHITDDAHQVLYTPCTLGGNACRRPASALEDVHFCTTHTQLTPFKRRHPPEETPTEESAEEKDHIDVVNDADVKTELVVETMSPPVALNHISSASPLLQTIESRTPVATSVMSAAQSSPTTSSFPAQSGVQPAMRTTSRPPSRPASRPVTPQVPSSS